MAMTLATVSLKDSSTWYTLLNLIYPVGSIYISYTATSPASRFGGSWSAITGKFIYANAGTGTGGANTVTLTASQIPDIGASYLSLASVYYGDNGGSSTGHVTYWGSHSGALVKGNLVGGGKSHNNMPAYQTVYCWRRTA